MHCPGVIIKMTLLSQAQNDPFFPYVPEQTGKITLPNGSPLQELISTDKRAPEVKFTNHVSLKQESDIVVKPDIADYEYDSDTKIDSFTSGRTKQRLLGKTKRAKALSPNAPMKIKTPIVETDQTGTSSTDIPL